MNRLQEQHLEVIVNFMEEHNDFAKGRLSISNARIKFRELWANLANKLNAIGLGDKSVEKWQKTWSDYKSNLKKRAAEIRTYQQGTGGGPSTSKSLSTLEQRILSILGPTFCSGLGVPEQGLNMAPLHHEEIIEETVDIPEVPLTKKRKASEKQDEVEKENHPPDHDYSVLNKTKKPKTKQDSTINAYNETIEELKSIKSVLEFGLENINSTLKECFQELNETFKNHKTHSTYIFFSNVQNYIFF